MDPNLGAMELLLAECREPGERGDGASAMELRPHMPTCVWNHLKEPAKQRTPWSRIRRLVALFE